MRDILSSFYDKWRGNYQFKTVFSTVVSCLINIVFAVFNGFLGIVYKSVWNGSIFVYYILLALIRGVIIYFQKNEGKRKKVFFCTHLLLLFMDIILIAPIAYMVLGERSYTFGMIPAIAMAAYTFYRIAMSLVHLKRAGKVSNILIKELRTINLTDALVAVLTLQNALIITKGASMQSMMALTGWTSAGIWILIVVITVCSLRSVLNP